MKIKLIMILSISCLLMWNATTYAANPASKEWVLQQIAANQRVLSAADWNAVCTSGSPTSSSGCYGNVSSAAFVKVSDRLGGFTTYANINPINATSSVFIKAFFGGTNVPVNANFLQVTLTNSAARCGLFTQMGQGLGVPGVSTSAPTSGNSDGGQPNGASVISINNTTSSSVYYNNNSFGGTLTPVTGPAQSNPLYLVCAGYNPNDGSTAASIMVAAI